MRKIVLFVLVIVCCSRADGQMSNAADPFGLRAFGFAEKREKRTLVKPAEGPPGARECGTGVYVREETVPVNDRPKKVKVAVIYFQPDPATLSVLRDWQKEGGKPLPGPPPSLGNLPVGVSSVTFFWPARSWPPQEVLLMRAEKVDGQLFEVSMSFFAVFAVQEGDSPSVLWTEDTSRDAGPILPSSPVLFKLSVPRGAKKCVEGK